MSWGGYWGTRWGGGGPAPAAVVAAPSQYAITILNRLEAAIVATASGMKPGTYRVPIERQPAGGAHRRFEVRLTGARIARQNTGAGIAFLELDVAVRVSYARLGGDAGGGDRKSINIQAGEDATLIQDALEDQRNWSRLTTDIRDVQIRIAAARVVDDKQREVWATQFRVEAEFPWPA